MTQNYIHTWLCFCCRCVLRSVSSEEFLQDCPTDICKRNQINLSKLLKQVGFKIQKDENKSKSLTKMVLVKCIM